MSAAGGAVMRGLAGHVAEAVVLLTRVPVRWRFVPAGARAAWAYPVVGAGVGAAVGAVAALGLRLGLGPGLSAGWALAASLLLTGALHEDGLADTADGIGGGRTPERRLAIMRDSRIGSFGALALALSVGLRWAALGALGEHAAGAGASTAEALPGWASSGLAGPAGLAGLVAAAAAAGSLARCAMLLPLRLPPARADGLAAGLGPVPGGVVIAGWACGIALALAVLPAGRAAAAALLAGAAGALLSRIGRQSLGGRTGDLLGAAEQLAECAVLTLLAR